MHLRTATTTTEVGTTSHVFAEAGLGAAPYVFTGMIEKTYCPAPGAPEVAGSSCDYCGKGIRYEFWLASADGREFKVGSNCINQSGDRGLIRRIAQAEREIRDKQNKRNAERRKQNKAEAIAQARADLRKVAGYFAARPHPTPYYANEGKTELDYVRFLLDAGSEIGVYIVRKAVENATATD